jgi:phosphinothricin acetyltransferase
MDSATIRASTEADIPAITRIYAYHVLNGTASFEIDAPDENEMARRRCEIEKRGLPYIVAEQNGLTVGYAYAGAYRPRPAYRFTVEDSIYIDPSYIGMASDDRCSRP